MKKYFKVEIQPEIFDVYLADESGLWWILSHSAVSQKNLPQCVFWLPPGAMEVTQDWVESQSWQAKPLRRTRAGTAGKPVVRRTRAVSETFALGA